MTVSPAEGPQILKGALLINGIINPPMRPERIPEKSGAPDAKAIPRHKGIAIRKTTKPAGRSVLRISVFRYVSLNSLKRLIIAFGILD
jgi:hypothetical protein